MDRCCGSTSPARIWPAPCSPKLPTRSVSCPSACTGAIPASSSARGGRGLILQPSFFCRYRPTSLFDPLLPPVLLYPIEHEAGWTDPIRLRDRSASLQTSAKLLGVVRARLLEAAADGTSTTGELARRAHTSPPNCSRHLAALRQAALIHSRRHRNTTLHTITPLGIALLNGRQPRLPA
ncbi:hypothetical protein DEJ48_26915 [Streptomyces venezuelae]|uniref:HTH arsR-type domain-containing protein n=1 Tax=Streptomyces venezuelae TaxID=54571 RepID=A0A5P2C1C6_STRVZ|nr:hypothetical protein DEJ48_26915 [Streptomyces venezuelae]